MISSELVLCSTPVQDPIPVLLISGRTKDHESLPNLLGSLDCVIFHAYACAEGAAVIRQYPIPVVVIDRTLPDGNWTEILSARCLSAIPPGVIVLGDQKDPDFWAGAFGLGAFDVLFRPLAEAIAIRAVTLGHLRWNRWAERLNAREQNVRTKESQSAWHKTAQSRKPVSVK